MKLYLLKTMLLLCALVVGSYAWAQAPVNTILWSETWTGGTAGEKPFEYGFEGTAVYGDATLTYANTSYNTILYNEILAGGTAPELLLSKSNETWTISNLPTGQATEMTLTFLSNKTTFNLTSTTKGISISGSQKSWTISAASTVSSFDLTLKNTGSSNARIDNVELIVKTAGATAPSYDITATSNNTSYGTVSLEGNVITATPASGYRYSTPAYTIAPANSATVEQSGNTFTVSPSANTTITINFEPIPTHTVTYSVNGSTTTQNFAEGATITFPSNPADIDGRTFVGWVDAPILGVIEEAPAFVSSPVMGSNDITYYAVFAEAEETEQTVETKTQTLQYDSWTYSGTTKDKSTYRLFGNNSYIESTSFNLSKLSKVIVYGGTFGGDTYKNLTIGDGTNTWKSGSVSGSSQTGTNTFTGGTTLSGTKPLRIISNSGDGENNGIRISKVEIFTNEPVIAYSNYCTTVAEDTRLAVNITGFTATDPTIIKDNTTTTTVTNDQSGWTAAYTYESDNTDVATVAEDGVITAVAKGTANITATLNVSKSDPNYKKGSTTSMSIVITVINPSHTVKFYNNGEEIIASTASVEEGESITFPSTNPADVADMSFTGWTEAAIDGTQTSAPTYVTTATMGSADKNFYAVFSRTETSMGNAELTITPNTPNIPESYGDANTFTEYSLGGKNFMVQQMYKNGGKLQWRASGNSSGTGTMYNSDPINKIQSIVLTYDSSDSNKNFTVKVGDAANPTSGTNITPTNSENVYTFDCSDQNKDYFVLTNGNGAGYLSSIKIVYSGVATSTIYCTSFTTTVPVTITTAKYATFSNARATNFSESGITVYTAKASGSVVKLTEVSDGIVPANTGVILYSASPVTKNVPFTTTNATQLENNEMVATVTRTQVGETGGAGYNYILQVGPVFNKANGGYMPAGKAYLSTTVNVAGARLSVVFDDETQGIGAMLNTETMNEVVYDLQGRRVAQPAKGLYIVNGQKVLVK